MVVTQKQCSACVVDPHDAVYHCPSIPFHPIPSYLLICYPFPFHSIISYLILSIPSLPMPSYPIPSCPCYHILSLFIASHATKSYSIPSYPIPSHQCPCCLIVFHLFPSHHAHAVFRCIYSSALFSSRLVFSCLVS